MEHNIWPCMRITYGCQFLLSVDDFRSEYKLLEESHKVKRIFAFDSCSENCNTFSIKYGAIDSFCHVTCALNRDPLLISRVRFLNVFLILAGPEGLNKKTSKNGPNEAAWQ